MAKPRDPRQMVTPDAFHVAPELLGLRLASPGRRAAAMLVDLALIGGILLLRNLSGALFGFILAWVLFRLSSRTAPGSVQGGFRILVRVAAVIVLLVATGTTLESCFSLGSRAAESVSESQGLEVLSVPGGALSAADIGQGIGDALALRRADSRDVAEAAARRLARRLHEAGARRDAIRGLLEELTSDPRQAEWSTGVIRTALGGLVPLPAESEDEPRVADSLAAALAQAVATEGTADVTRLRRELAAQVSSGQTAALERQIAALREQVEQAEARAERKPGILSFLRAEAEDLGLSFGWGGLFFTIFLARWKGRTPGKKLLGLRVVRLSGEPMGWWPAFERFGGYAASLATGSLGFLQILWDPNRQGVHDKVVGTVVIRDSEDARRAIERAENRRAAGSPPGEVPTPG